MLVEDTPLGGPEWLKLSKEVVKFVKMLGTATLKRYI
jgi:hypothetical protein